MTLHIKKRNLKALHCHFVALKDRTPSFATIELDTFNGTIVFPLIVNPNLQPPVKQTFLEEPYHGT